MLTLDCARFTRWLYRRVTPELRDLFKIVNNCMTDIVHELQVRLFE